MEKSLELKEKENKGKKGICRIELQVYGTLEKRVEFKKLKATRCLFSFEIEILDLASQKEHMKSAHMVKNAAVLEACKESQEVKIVNFVSVKE